ncbi:glycosyl transferase family 2, partial [Halobacteriales archaeon QH_7_68_42]
MGTVPEAAAVFGLDVSLTLVFLVVGLAVFLWGFARYRRTFWRTELAVATLIALGVWSVGVFPDLFLVIADVLRLSETFRAVQIVANVAFVFLLLYALSLINDN